jgi:hypothetical protein
MSAMSRPTEYDEEQWRAVRSWLEGDEQGKKILATLVSDPQVGAVALKRRMRDTAQGATNTFTDTQIEKFVTLAHADRVYLGDQTVNVDQSYHVVDLDPNPIHRARAFPRFLMISGTLICMGGVALALYGMYVTVTSWNAMADTLRANPGQMPTNIGLAPESFIGFGVFFGGLALIVIGNLFRPKERRPAAGR